MKIEETKSSDLQPIIDLVERVVQETVIPHFSEKGRTFFQLKCDQTLKQHLINLGLEILK